MDSAFAWIGQLMEWLGRFIPRPVIVRRTHAGVKFVWGHKIVELKPGIHFYWPLVTEVEIMPTARQTMNLTTQVLMTKDGHKVSVGAVVVYEIADITAVLANNWDINDTISDITQMAVVRVITQWVLAELMAEISDKVENKLTIEVRAKLKPFGVKVERCGLTDFAQAHVVRLLTDAGAT